jgi:hypothetical protein
MAMPSACVIGHFPHFTVGSGSVPIRSIGPALLAMKTARFGER